MSSTEPMRLKSSEFSVRMMLLKKFDTEWGGSVDPVFTELAY
jgi:hypothetical protein